MRWNADSESSKSFCGSPHSTILPLATTKTRSDVPTMVPSLCATVSTVLPAKASSTAFCTSASVAWSTAAVA